MSKLMINGVITLQQQVVEGYYLMEFSAPELAAIAKPGQFLHIKCGTSNDPLLRRPISINSINRKAGTVRVLYRLAGRGTELLAGMQPGQQLDVIGPLGKGFTIKTENKKVLLVAGGIGVAPLYFLIEELVANGVRPTVLIGARAGNDLLLVPDIEKLGAAVKVATEDGSNGIHGRVTELLADLLPGTDQVYTCGPAPMMKAVAALTAAANIPTEVSLEERMGCGVGACLACSCKIKVGDGSEYKRVCADGPVFNAEEVCWHE